MINLRRSWMFFSYGYFDELFLSSRKHEYIPTSSLVKFCICKLQVPVIFSLLYLFDLGFIAFISVLQTASVSFVSENCQFATFTLGHWTIKSSPILAYIFSLVTKTNNHIFDNHVGRQTDI